MAKEKEKEEERNKDRKPKKKKGTREIWKKKKYLN
jgi:hypothetical protein